MPMFLTADAGAAAPAGNNIWSMLIMIGVLVVVFYFFIIRPQKKQDKEANELRNSLSVGDEVTTIGGIIGRVVNVKDDTFVLETTRERTKIRFERSALKRIDRKFDAPEAVAEEAAVAPEEAPAVETTEVVTEEVVDTVKEEAVEAVKENPETENK